ncbi:GNAT family N-acetyltransferase [Clostridioides difficile]|nr:GNAT family N-acetyltransferase [Clostridioides difficile]
MKFERLRTSEDRLYYKAMELYKTSFPFHEQRKYSLQSEIMENEEYQFNLIYDKDQFVGIILCWETENFIYVEHFCIFPEMRNNRYGQRTLEVLNKREKTVILEIDPPIDDISIQRKKFYERVKYKSNDYKHIHPPYQYKFSGHHLIVMSYPEILSKIEYCKFNQYLRNHVMSF